MIKIEISGSSADEALGHLRALAASLAITNVTAVLVNEATTEEKSAKPVKQKKAKPEVAEEATVDPTPAEPVAETTEPTAAEPEEATTDGTSTSTAPAAADAKELVFDVDVAPLVLRKVQTAGKPAVSAILEQFGVERASQLEPARWPELVALLSDLD